MVGYLGYEWQKEFSILVSTLTIILNKELHATFFNKVEVKGHTLQGFSLSYEQGYLGPDMIEVADKIITDKGFKTIFRNKESTSEVLFTVCENAEVMNSWYKERWKGTVAGKLCDKFDYFRRETIDPSDEEVEEARKMFEKETELLTV